MTIYFSHLAGEADKQLSLELDRLGVASAKVCVRCSYFCADMNYDHALVLRDDNEPLFLQAQKLNMAITSYKKLRESDHTIILSYQEDSSSDDKTKPLKLNGFLKYGRKDLYFYHTDGKITRSSPLCLLDFYVDEEVQRGGLGLALFHKMLEVIKSKHHITILIELND